MEASPFEPSSRVAYAATAAATAASMERPGPTHTDRQPQRRQDVDDRGCLRPKPKSRASAGSTAPTVVTEPPHHGLLPSPRKCLGHDSRMRGAGLPTLMSGTFLSRLWWRYKQVT